MTLLAGIGFDAYSIATMVLAVAAVIGIVYVQFRGNSDADGADADRAFFDEHGRWPDEPESAAVQRPGGYGKVDDLPGRD
ncbi:MAG: hypothetical protein JWO90_2555 [Solirubrobacterales bacterium]|nr:hypothetical protein [Solirubrobacterales bacterium]